MGETGAETLPAVSAETVLTDRQMLAHLLTHAEWQSGKMAELAAEFERYRPLLEQAEQRAKRWGFVTGTDRAAPGGRRAARAGRIGG